MTAINVSLTPELDRFVRDAVSDGRYRSSSEVVREALRMPQGRQRRDALKLDALRQKIALGIASGPAQPLDMAAIKAGARPRFEADTRSATPWTDGGRSA